LQYDKIVLNQDRPLTVARALPNRTKATFVRWRFAWATMFATTTAMCVIPSGCAVTDEQAVTPPQPSDLSSFHRALSPSTVVALQNCVNEGVSRLSRHSYELAFEVQVTRQGVVDDVDLNGKGLDDVELEECMIDALEAMVVSDLLLQDTSLPTTSQNVLPSGRTLIGTADVLPQLIELAPIVVSASGVTIVVGVGVIVLTTAVIAHMSKECKAEWRRAKKKCRDYLDSNDPPTGVTGGYINTKDFARGLVSMRCGGNRADDGGQGARPGRRT
jgi:hypothetical protein